MTLNTEALAQLGLEGCSFEDAISYGIDDNIGFGFAHSSVPELDKLSLNESFEPLFDSPSLEVYAHCKDPRVLLFSSNSPLRVLGVDEGVVFRQEDRVYLDLRRAQGLVAVLSGDLLGHVVKVEDDVPTLYPLKNPLSSPLKSWLAGIDDPWLVSSVKARLALNDTWQEVVGLGMLLRFHEGDVAKKVAAMLSGNYTPRRERVWAQTLSKVAVSYLSSWAVSVSLLLTETLEALSDEETRDEGWVRAVVRQGERRDELEGIRALLSARGDGSEEGLARMLKGLDEVCEVVMGKLPAMSADSEHLEHASALAQGCWWVEPVSP